MARRPALLAAVERPHRHVWVPLQDTPEELGPLTIAAGSHRSEYGRELAIGDESEARLDAFVTESGYRVDDSPYANGDVSFHAGWTIHRAPYDSVGPSPELSPPVS